MKRFWTKAKPRTDYATYNTNKEIEILWSYHPLSGDTLHRTVLDGKVNGSRRPGRPRTRWITGSLDSLDHWILGSLEYQCQG